MRHRTGGFIPLGFRPALLARKQAGQRKRGFTLIEILLVVVIMAVIAVLAVPNFSRTYAGMELRKAADDLAYHMRYAQSYAITKNTRARLEFDALFTQYWLTRPTGSLREQSEDEAAPDTFERLTGRLGQSISLPRDVRLSFEDGDPSLFFYPDGTIDKRRISLCRDLPAGRAGPAQRDRQECVFVSTQKQRGRVDVFKQSDESL